VFLWHRDPASPGVCLPGVAHKSYCCADEGIRVAAAQALCIIYEDGDYMLSLTRAGFDTLEARRKQLTEHNFRRSVLPETSCLHYLLPCKRDVSVTSRL